MKNFIKLKRKNKHNAFWKEFREKMKHKSIGSISKKLLKEEQIKQCYPQS